MCLLTSKGLFALLAILFVQVLQVTASIYLQDNARARSHKTPAKSSQRHFEIDFTKEGSSGALTASTDTDEPMDEPMMENDDHGHDGGERHLEAGDLRGHHHKVHEHGGSSDAGHAHSLVFDARIEKHVGTYVLEFGIASHRCALSLSAKALAFSPFLFLTNLLNTAGVFNPLRLIPPFSLSHPSVLIGIALGVATDEFKTLLAALIFHQFFEGLSLGTVILESGFNARWQPFAMVLFYSITTPIGVAIGVGLHETYNENARDTLIVNGVLDSISSGILIYDSLVNIITPHIACPLFRETNWLSRVMQIASLWLGAGIMAIIGRWA
jgi:hypothetical protein